jgi:hypothetical protein
VIITSPQTAILICSGAIRLPVCGNAGEVEGSDHVKSYTQGGAFPSPGELQPRAALFLPSRAQRLLKQRPERRRHDTKPERAKALLDGVAPGR